MAESKDTRAGERAYGAAHSLVRFRPEFAITAGASRGSKC